MAGRVLAGEASGRELGGVTGRLHLARQRVLVRSEARVCEDVRVEVLGFGVGDGLVEPRVEVLEHLRQLRDAGGVEGHVLPRSGKRWTVSERTVHNGVGRSSQGPSTKLRPAAMARPRQFDESSVLDRALDLFWSKGYEATSVQDLVDATGLGRASLYGAFGDKEQLFNRVLSHYMARVAEEMSALDAEPSAARALERLFTGWLSFTCPKSGPRGCFLL